MAMQMLYQQELGGSSLDQIFASFDPRADFDPREDHEDGEAPAPGHSETRRRNESFLYAQRLVEGTIGNLSAIDTMIRQHAENWRLERMPAIDRNILRLAVYEMLFETRVPKVVIVDEAIELAKKFGSENSGRFVNGLLDGVLQSRASAVEAV